MHPVIQRIHEQLTRCGLTFTQPPLVVGGMAMEYHGLRPAGADIDLIICDGDYQALAARFPDQRKDLYGDLGVVIDPFEIWRSIALFDYDYLGQGALETQGLRIIGLDRLLLMRVCAMDVEKYRRDLELMRSHYYRTRRNPAFSREAELHAATYAKTHGLVWGGAYQDD